MDLVRPKVSKEGSRGCVWLVDECIFWKQACNKSRMSRSGNEQFNRCGRPESIPVLKNEVLRAKECSDGVEDRSRVHIERRTACS